MADIKLSVLTGKGADVASAGTLVLGAGEFFHITGTTGITDIDFTETYNGRRACLIFDGVLTVTHNATTLKLPGEANIITAAGDRMWVVVDSGDNVIVIDHIPALIAEEFWIRQAASRSLTSSTSEQKLFNAVANGAVTLPVGVYFFECSLYLTGMSTTSGNAAFDLLGAGTATLVDVLYSVIAQDVVAGGAGTAITGSTNIQGQTNANMATAAIPATLGAHFTGSFEVSVAGTLIPSLTLVTAAAATVAAGTYFSCRRVGGAGGVSNGPWS